MSVSIKATLPVQNQILRAFPPETIKRLHSHLEYTEMPLQKTLYRAYDPITHVYFPEKSLISILASTESGQNAEIAIVGSEGAVGLDVMLGAESVPHDAMVQMPNSGYRIKATILKNEFDKFDDVRAPILRFIQKLMVQIAQTTLCNRLHHIDKRLCRWLLMCHDRADDPTLRLTHEFLAVMLGVTRVSVTQSASELQSVGYISYSRGLILILDRPALEARSCECYRTVKDEYDRR